MVNVMQMDKDISYHLPGRLLHCKFKLNKADIKYFERISRELELLLQKIILEKYDIP